MRKQLRSLWPLFFGVFLIGLCVGAQGTLVGLRSALEGFEERTIGLIMSAYYGGFLLGALRGQAIIRRVGHVRTFGALTALASVSILFHPLHIDPMLWMLTRVFLGFSMCGIFLVAESWLSQAADDSNRSRVLSIYMIVMHSGILGGQFILKLGEPLSFELFSVISVLLSVAAIPMLLMVTSVPVVEPVQRISFKVLFRWAPLGFIGAFLMQMCSAMAFSMAPVVASGLGYSPGQIAYLMAAVVFGALVFQWPLAMLFDLVGRRPVVTILAAAGSLVSLVAALVADSSFVAFLITMTVFGGFVLPLYSFYSAIVYDYMKPEKIVSANAAILLVGGTGASFGPLVAAVLMNEYQANGFFLATGTVLALASGAGVYRMLLYSTTSRYQTHEFTLLAGNFGVGLDASGVVQAGQRVEDKQ